MSLIMGAFHDCHANLVVQCHGEAAGPKPFICEKSKRRQRIQPAQPPGRPQTKVRAQLRVCPELSRTRTPRQAPQDPQTPWVPVLRRVFAARDGLQAPRPTPRGGAGPRVPEDSSELRTAERVCLIHPHTRA